MLYVGVEEWEAQDHESVATEEGSEEFGVEELVVRNSVGSVAGLDLLGARSCRVDVLEEEAKVDQLGSEMREILGHSPDQDLGALKEVLEDPTPDLQVQMVS